MATILVVDDEPAIIDALKYNLEKNLYRTLVALDGERALEIARRENPDLIILDIMLPTRDGIEVCRILRQESDVPIIMLTARDEEVDRVLGLEIGADDYVVKPFSMRELMARVKTVLRRSQSQSIQSDKPLTAGKLTLDPGRHEARYYDEALSLSALEFDLLFCLARHANQVMTREQLLDQVWGYDYFGDTRVVDTAIKRLRGKLKQSSDHPENLVITVRGVGYKLDSKN